MLSHAAGPSARRGPAERGVHKDGFNSITRRRGEEQMRDSGKKGRASSGVKDRA